MRKKTSEILKKNLIGFVLGIISACTISVIAATYFPSNDVTYDNTESGLQATNVQGAIDELYGVCFPPKAGDTILDSVDIVTSGDGLYEDEYEDGRYIYKGGNPNNYIMFSGELWRIYSIEKEGTIKIIKNDSLGEMAWDSGGISDWSKASLKDYLNGEYYESLIDKDLIVDHDWGIRYSDTVNDMAAEIAEENAITWNGKIAIIALNEYYRANSNKAQCGTLSLNQGNNLICNSTNWIIPMIANVDYMWTLTPTDSFSNWAQVIYSKGDRDDNIGVTNSEGVGGKESIFPMLYLSSNIKITGGNGSKSNPYTIE